MTGSIRLHDHFSKWDVLIMWLKDYRCLVNDEVFQHLRSLRFRLLSLHHSFSSPNQVISAVSPEVLTIYCVKMIIPFRAHPVMVCQISLCLWLLLRHSSFCIYFSQIVVCRLCKSAQSVSCLAQEGSALVHSYFFMLGIMPVF